MIFDAIVLSGGRSSRLGGEAKAALVVEGRSLLATALAAAAGARRTVVVGDATAVPAGVRVTREDPPFGGPAAGIAAGMGALAAEPGSDFILVLACDMPNSSAAVRELVTRAGTLAGTDGVVAVDQDGHRQQLLGLYRSGQLAAAVQWFGSDIQNLAVRELLAQLTLVEVPVPPGSTADVDTWPDAERFGIERPPSLATTETDSTAPREDNP